MVACALGDAGGVKAMLKSGFDVNTTGVGGKTGLHASCKHGRVAVMTLLIEAKCDLDVQAGSLWRTAFMVACCRGHTLLACMLADVGCKVLLVDDGRCTGYDLAKKNETLKHELQRRDADVRGLDLPPPTPPS